MAYATYINASGNTVTVNWTAGSINTNYNNCLYGHASQVAYATALQYGLYSGWTEYRGAILFESGSKWVLTKLTGQNLFSKDTVGNNVFVYTLLLSYIYSSEDYNGYSEFFYLGSNQNIGYYPKDLTEAVKIMVATHAPQTIEAFTPEQMVEYICSKKLVYNNLPVYVDKTLVNFTDGTYVVRNGALDATSARSEGYKQLLNTYGTFYKGTERELASSFATELAPAQSL